jgi:hypothetical protein
MKREKKGHTPAEPAASLILAVPTDGAVLQEKKEKTSEHNCQREVE